VTPSESAVKVHSKEHQVTVTYDGSDTVTSCSYTTPPDSTHETKALPEPEGVHTSLPTAGA
jgi:hypothetical protein